MIRIFEAELSLTRNTFAIKSLNVVSVITLSPFANKIYLPKLIDILSNIFKENTFSLQMHLNSMISFATSQGFCHFAAHVSQPAFAVLQEKGDIKPSFIDKL